MVDSISYVERDISGSLQWLNISRQDPLWSYLPKDLKRAILKYFVFRIGQCWCGRFQRFDIMIKNYKGRRKFCSSTCDILYRQLTICGGRKPPGLRYVITCGYMVPSPCKGCKIILREKYFVEARHKWMYCVACFEKIQQNGLILEKNNRRG